MIARKDYRPDKFNRCSRAQANAKPLETLENTIVCERKRSKFHRNCKPTSTTKFTSTSELSLEEISCYLHNRPGEIKAKIKIYQTCRKSSRGTLISYVKTWLKSNYIDDVKLPAPILIQPLSTYKIDVELKSTTCTPSTYKKTPLISGGTVIDISDKKNYSFVSGLQFVQSKD